MPPELGKLTDLEILEINDNRLTGQLPYELTELEILDTLYFNGNDGLCAPSDAAFQDWLKRIPQVKGDTCEAGPAEPDLTALTAFYNATNGDNWHRNDNWLTDAPLDEWYGVATDDTLRIISLDLERNNLSGQIPPQLGNLSNLKNLELGYNNLTGAIPAELGNLNSLISLRLTYSGLTGAIPSDLGDLVNLHQMGLGNNDLTGEIPSALGNLENLIDLRLSYNKLTGVIPLKLGNLSICIS